MAKSSLAFVQVPPRYADLISMINAHAPVEECLQKVVSLMRSHEIWVFNQYLSHDEYVEQINALSRYIYQQQRRFVQMPIDMPGLAHHQASEMYLYFQRILDRIQETQFVFAKDFSRWFPLTLASMRVSKLEKLVQGPVVLLDHLKVAEYIKLVRQALLHVQQIENKTATAQEWLNHFNHVLPQPVDTEDKVLALKVVKFKMIMLDLISRWYHCNQLVQDPQSDITLDDLYNPKYTQIVLPSAESAKHYQPAVKFADSFAEVESPLSFPHRFFQAGLLFMIFRQMTMAAGANLSPSHNNASMCLLEEGNEVAVSETLQQPSLVSLEHVLKDNISPEEQGIPDYFNLMATAKTDDSSQQDLPVDVALIKQAQVVMLSSLTPLAAVSVTGLNAHEAAFAKNGMQDNPTTVFRYSNKVLELSELKRNDFYYAPGAAIVEFNHNSISEDLMHLKKDINRNNPEAANVIKDIENLQKPAVYHVMFGYLYGNALLEMDNEKGYRWAIIAANLGNVIAAMHLCERAYPFPDRNYDAVVAEIAGGCPATIEVAAEKKKHYLQESRKYLCTAAANGHAPASKLLGDAMLYGYFGEINKKLALRYYVQAIIQSSNAIYGYTGAIHAALGIIEDSLNSKNIKGISWANLDANDYLDIYRELSKTAKTLAATLDSADEILTKRAFLPQMVQHTENSVNKQINDESIINLRSAIRKARTIQHMLTIDVNQPGFLPSPAKLNAFGVYFESLKHQHHAKPQSHIPNDSIGLFREKARRGSATESLQLAYSYAYGNGVTQNLDIATFFFRQALKLSPALASAPQIANQRATLEEHRLKAKLQAVVHTLSNPFKIHYWDGRFARMSEERAHYLGIQIPAHQKQSEWSIGAIRGAQKIPVELLLDLKNDISSLPDKLKISYLSYYSALCDGDCADLPKIVMFYRSKKAKRIQWLIVAASHGHLPSLRELGRMYKLGLVPSAESQSECLRKGIKKIALAAAHGDAKATKDMLEIARNGELDLLRLDIDKDKLIQYYKNQCYRQDPAVAASLVAEIEQGHSLAKAIRAEGFNLKSASDTGVDLTWNPIKRDRSDKNMELLFGLLRQHHADKLEEQEWENDFYAGDNKCFMRAAVFYLNSRNPGLSAASRQLLSISWAVMGLRCGDVSSGSHIASSLDVIHHQEDVQPDLWHLFSDIYQDLFPEKKDHVVSGTMVEETRFEKFVAINKISLLFSAYFHNSTASIVLSKENRRSSQVNWNEINSLVYARAYLAQAILQGQTDWNTYFQFVDKTVLILEQAIEISSIDETKESRDILTIEYLLNDNLDGLLDFIELTRLKLEAYYADQRDPTALLQLHAYRTEIEKLTGRCNKAASYSVSLRYHDAGVQTHEHHNQLHDSMIRPHKRGERRDIIPGMRHADYSIMNQRFIRDKTLVRLALINDNVFDQLKQIMLTEPADMLHISELCAQHDMHDLAIEWLKHAASTGDKMAIRILTLQGPHTRKQICELARHGDPVAVRILLESPETKGIYRELLGTQLEHLLKTHYDRDVFDKPKLPIKPENQTHVTPVNYNWLLAAVPGMMFLLSVIYGWRRYLTYRSLRNKKQAHNIDYMQTHFNKMKFVEAAYHPQLNVIEAAIGVPQHELPEIHGLMLGQVNAYACSAAEREIFINQLLKRAMAILEKFSVVSHADDISESAALEILGITCKEDKKKNLFHYSSKRMNTCLQCTSEDQRRLFEAFALMSSFRVEPQMDGKYHLHWDHLQPFICTPALAMLCEGVVNVMLTAKKAQMDQEKEAADKAAATKQRYTKAVISLNQYDIEILKTAARNLCAVMTAERLRSADSVVMLCTNLLGLLEMCAVVTKSEDKEYIINFESELSAALRILKPEHHLRKKVQEEKDYKHDTKADHTKRSDYDGTEKRARKEAEKAARDAAKRKQESKSAVEPSTRKVSLFQQQQSQIPQPPAVQTKANSKSSPAGHGVVRTLAELRAQKDKKWPFDQLNRYRDSLHEILNEPAFSFDSCKLLRLRALTFRLMRTLLFIDILNDDGGGEERCVSDVVRNINIRNTVSLFLAGIKHNIQLVDLVMLEECVKEYFKSDSDNMTVVFEEVKKSNLYNVVVPSVQDVKIPRTLDKLFTDLAAGFHELKTLDLLYKKLSLNKKADDSPRDGFRGVLMLIGEIGQRFYEACPNLKNDVYQHFRSLKNLMNFIYLCHVSHRNIYGHVSDLRALYESSMSKNAVFERVNTPGIELESFVRRGIIISENAGIFDELKAAYITIMNSKVEQANRQMSDMNSEFNDLKMKDTFREFMLADMSIHNGEDPVIINNNNNNESSGIDVVKLHFNF